MRLCESCGQPQQHLIVGELMRWHNFPRERRLFACGWALVSMSHCLPPPRGLLPSPSPPQSPTKYKKTATLPHSLPFSTHVPQRPCRRDIASAYSDDTTTSACVHKQGRRFEKFHSWSSECYTETSPSRHRDADAPSRGALRASPPCTDR